ncbi:hypothetical protein MS3_00010707 [Schistosoma haematobium]|uniref:Uncharacterized protein n=1 Tax=Schistosoma haematobium TaxID=6185 RepID=A0A922IGD4_SCHHA|nr:uncharacterized protein MS3_00010707 [Schistosoma haematobium]KAH9578496.1 hypothetical protein MS3_00010707 [Schistosoma haematobium]
MGSTNSRIETNLNPIKTYTGFENHDNELVISKESFRNKFDLCFYDLADLLWDNFKGDRNSNDEFLVLRKYQSIIEYLSSAQDKLKIFLSLFKLRALSESDVKALFKWFLLGRDLKPDTWQLIITSILSSVSPFNYTNSVLLYFISYWSNPFPFDVIRCFSGETSYVHTIEGIQGLYKAF